MSDDVLQALGRTVAELRDRWDTVLAFTPDDPALLEHAVIASLAMQHYAERADEIADDLSDDELEAVA